MLSMSSDEEEYSEIATPDLINYDDKKLVNDKYGSISLCKFKNFREKLNFCWKLPSIKFDGIISGFGCRTLIIFQII